MSLLIIDEVPRREGADLIDDYAHAGMQEIVIVKG